MLRLLELEVAPYQFPVEDLVQQITHILSVTLTSITIYLLQWYSPSQYFQSLLHNCSGQRWILYTRFMAISSRSLSLRLRLLSPSSVMACSSTSPNTTATKNKTTAHFVCYSYLLWQNKTCLLVSSLPRYKINSHNSTIITSHKCRPLLLLGLILVCLNRP